MGIILAVFSAVVFAFIMFLGKQTVNKKADPLVISTFYQIAAAIFYLPSLFFEELHWPVTADLWLLFALNMVLYTVFTIGNFYMNKYLDISLSSILGQSKTAITFIGALILFQEAVTWNKVVGVVLIIIGSVLLFLKRGTSFEGFNKKGLILVAITTLALTITAFIDARLIQTFSVNFFGMISYLMPGLLTIPILLKMKTKNEIMTNLKSNFNPILLMGLIAPIAYSSLLMAYRLAPKSVVYPIGNISTLVMVLLGIIFLKERQMLQRKLIAAVIVVIGAILLSI